MSPRSARPESAHFRRRLIPERGPVRRIVWIGVGAVLFYLLILSDFGLLRRWRLGREAAAIETRIEHLEVRKAALEAQRGELDDDAALERIAREKYGMVKKGEHVYRLAGPDSAGSHQ